MDTLIRDIFSRLQFPIPHQSPSTISEEFFSCLKSTREFPVACSAAPPHVFKLFMWSSPLKVSHFILFRRVQQDFRLHQADAAVLVRGTAQSNDVTRINRMFIVQHQKHHQQQQKEKCPTIPPRKSTGIDSDRQVTHRGSCGGGGGGALKGRPIILSRKMETLPEW